MLKPFAACTVLVLLGIATLHAQTPVQPSPVKRTILQKTDVPGTNLEMIYANVEIAPGFKAGRHFHPGVVMAQVVDGETVLAHQPPDPPRAPHHRPRS